MADWEKTPPKLYDVATGFFPESEPKDTWATNPRPLLICGIAWDVEAGLYFCRVAYGTSKPAPHDSDDLEIANLSMLDALGLKMPTRFVISRGSQMAILPWNSAHFRPWTGKASPVLSRLDDAMQRYVGYTLAELADLPQF